MTSPTRRLQEAFARIARERSTQVVRRCGARHGLTQLKSRKQTAVFQLIAAHRFHGMRHADLDPLEVDKKKPNIPELDPAFYGLSDADMDTRVRHCGTFVGPSQASLRDILPC